MQAIMTVGVSASGKSSYAHMMELEGYEIVERDHTRFTKVMPESTGWKGKVPYKFTNENEAKVTIHVFGQIAAQAVFGENIILSDTWLNKKNRRKMYNFVKKLGYDIKVVVFEVPLNVVIERDSYRGNFSVGEEVIRRQWDQFQGAKSQLIAEKGMYGLEVVTFHNYGEYLGKEKL